MERTGHSSVAGVRSYKRTTSEQKENVSDLMCSKKQKVDCEAEKENRETNPATVAIQARRPFVPVQGSCPTLPQPTLGANPGGFTFNISGCTLNFNC